ncbi:MAG TPA: hypothetical protein VGX48_16100 [Pyrinomonadaceae bacterium]|jgi:hypothetical protein|nr:hypothetical protein [Pyrinomonadaceae bacterium]
MSRKLLLLSAFAALACAGAARAQSPEQKVTVTVKPAQTAEERVAEEFKEKALRKAAEEKLAEEESAKMAATSPRALLARARTVYVSSGTSFFESVQLRDALLKRPEAEAWQLALIDGGWDKANAADIFVEVDRPLFTYTFTYQITHRATGVVLASGKVTAFDSNAAAPKLAARVVEEIRKARGESKDKK